MLFSIIAFWSAQAPEFRFLGEAVMKCSHTFLFFSLILCATASAQDRGIIRCDADMNQVPAWTAPGKPHIVEQLACDQMVSIVGLERGYVKIQIGDKTAYVDAKYVRLSESREQRITEPLEQPEQLQQPLPSAISTTQPLLRDSKPNIDEPSIFEDQTAEDDKEKNISFVDAVLLKQELIDNGMSCSSSGTGEVEDDGDIQTRGTAECSKNTIAHYTVQSGVTLYILQPRIRRPWLALVTLGWYAVLAKNSVLHGIAPGTSVRMRIPEDGKTIIRVADGRESPYRIVGASLVPQAESSQASKPTPMLCLETVTDSEGKITCRKWATP